jgi:hypothetical protein
LAGIHRVSAGDVAPENRNPKAILVCARSSHTTYIAHPAHYFQSKQVLPLVNTRRSNLARNASSQTVHLLSGCLQSTYTYNQPPDWGRCNADMQWRKQNTIQNRWIFLVAISSNGNQAAESWLGPSLERLCRVSPAGHEGSWSQAALLIASPIFLGVRRTTTEEWRVDLAVRPGKDARVARVPADRLGRQRVLGHTPQGPGKNSREKNTREKNT